jgi:hypothetical protein
MSGLPSGPTLSIVIAAVQSHGCFRAGFVVGFGRNSKPSSGEESVPIVYQYHGEAASAFMLGPITSLYLNNFALFFRPSSPAWRENSHY